MSVSIDELEMAAADLEVASVFKEAADNFLDELRIWLAPDGDCPNAALLGEVHKAQTMLLELDGRIHSARSRVQNAMEIGGAA